MKMPQSHITRRDTEARYNQTNTETYTHRKNTTKAKQPDLSSPAIRLQN